MDYNQTIAFLQSFPDSERGTQGAKPARSLKMPLSTMRALLQLMGNPQNATKTIHITGSKGKGSTATFVATILNKAGYRTALFTSPHLHSYQERIAFDLQLISKEDFARGISSLKPIIEKFDQQGNTISTFGILTALFFYLVKNANLPIDWQIVEVGLGGKDDVTNVFEHKEAAVITPISLEHTAILGMTRGAIAENKAGIITPGCLTIMAPQHDPEVVKIIREKCIAESSELIEVNAGDTLGVELKLLGEHQIANAATAKAVIRALIKNGCHIDESAIQQGLESAYLPGRFEIIQASDGSSAPIVLDGAHNGDSAAALAKTLNEVFPERLVLFIIGVNQDKNIEDIWLSLKEKACGVIVTRSDNYRSMPTEEMQARILACDASAKIICTNNIDQALQKARKILKSGQVLCICGSLYLVAESREKLSGLG